MRSQHTNKHYWTLKLLYSFRQLKQIFFFHYLFILLWQKCKRNCVLSWLICNPFLCLGLQDENRSQHVGFQIIKSLKIYIRKKRKTNTQIYTWISCRLCVILVQKYESGRIQADWNVLSQVCYPTKIVLVFFEQRRFLQTKLSLSQSE